MSKGVFYMSSDSDNLKITKSKRSFSQNIQNPTKVFCKDENTRTSSSTLSNEIYRLFLSTF